jgi:hypothetical protein
MLRRLDDVVSWAGGNMDSCTTGTLAEQLMLLREE